MSQLPSEGWLGKTSVVDFFLAFYFLDFLYIISFAFFQNNFFL